MAPEGKKKDIVQVMLDGGNTPAWMDKAKQRRGA